MRDVCESGRATRRSPPGRRTPTRARSSAASQRVVDEERQRRERQRPRERGHRRPRPRRRRLGLRLRPAARRRRSARRRAPRVRIRARRGRSRRDGARAARGRERDVPNAGRDAIRSRSRSPTRSRSACAPRRRSRHPDVKVDRGVRPRARASTRCCVTSDGAEIEQELVETGGGIDALAVERRRLPDPQLPERARRLERAGGLGVRRGPRARARGAARRRAGGGAAPAPTRARRA